MRRFNFYSSLPPLIRAGCPLRFALQGLSVAQKPKEIYGADYGHQKKSRFPQIGRDKNRLILF